MVNLWKRSRTSSKKKLNGDVNNSAATNNNVPKMTVQTSDFYAQYHLHEELGQGQYAIVRRCTKIRTGEQVAAKFVRKRTDKKYQEYQNPFTTEVAGVTLDEIEREVSILNSLSRHPNIVTLLEVFNSKDDFILVFELVEGGELFHLVQSRGNLSENETRCVMRQLVSAVANLHAQSIVHLDIKPENVLIDDDAELRIKLIDFGLSKKISPGKSIRDLVGTPEFVAPEVINYDDITLLSDMWSVGVIAFYLMTGQSPFEGNTPQETLELVTIGKIELERSRIAFSPVLMDFLSCCLKRRAHERISASDLMAHPWLSDDPDNQARLPSLPRRSSVLRPKRMVTRNQSARNPPNCSSPNSPPPNVTLHHKHSHHSATTCSNPESSDFALDITTAPSSPTPSRLVSSPSSGGPISPNSIESKTFFSRAKSSFKKRYDNFVTPILARRQQSSRMSMMSHDESSVMSHEDDGPSSASITIEDAAPPTSSPTKIHPQQSQQQPLHLVKPSHSFVKSKRSSSKRRLLNNFEDSSKSDQNNNADKAPTSSMLSSSSATSPSHRTKRTTSFSDKLRASRDQLLRSRGKISAQQLSDQQQTIVLAPAPQKKKRSQSKLALLFSRLGKQRPNEEAAVSDARSVQTASVVLPPAVGSVTQYHLSKWRHRESLRMETPETAASKRRPPGKLSPQAFQRVSRKPDHHPPVLRYPTTTNSTTNTSSHVVLTDPTPTTSATSVMTVKRSSPKVDKSRQSHERHDEAKHFEEEERRMQEMFVSPSISTHDHLARQSVPPVLTTKPRSIDHHHHVSRTVSSPTKSVSLVQWFVNKFYSVPSTADNSEPG